MKKKESSRVLVIDDDDLVLTDQTDFLYQP